MTQPIPLTALQERQLKLLQETRDFYAADPKGRRGKSHERGFDSCVYRTSDGRACAVGRIILDDALAHKLDQCDSTDVRSVFGLLPQDVQELGMDFLADLQTLHDRESHWAETGLSPDGVVYFEQMERDIRIGYYTPMRG